MKLIIDIDKSVWLEPEAVRKVVEEYLNQRQFKWRLATGGSSVKSVQILQEPTVKG